MMRLNGLSIWVPPSIQSSDFLTEYHAMQSEMRELYMKVRDEYLEANHFYFLLTPIMCMM